MIYLKIKSGFAYCVIFLLFFYACSGTKNSSKVSQEKGNINSGFSSEQQRLEFDFYFYNGAKEKALDNIQEAGKNFKKCIEISPTTPAANYEFGICLFKLGDIKNAEKFASQAVKLSPENDYYQMFFAQTLAASKKFKEASKVFEKLYKNNPDNLENLENWITTLLFIPDYKAALNVYDILEKKIGLNEGIVRQKIRIYNAQNQFSKSENEVKRLIATDPLNVNFQILLGDLYLENNMDEKALLSFKQCIALEPNNPYPHLALADYYRKNNKSSEYYAETKKAFASDELDADTKIKILAPFYNLSKDNKEQNDFVHELLDLFIQSNPKEAKAYAIKGDFLLKEEKLNEAREQYRKALEIDKNKYSVWNQLMLIDSQLNDNEQLDKDSKQAIELFPNEPVPYLLNGIANYQLKNYKQTISVLNKGIDFVVQNNAMLAQFNANLGDAYQNDKQYAKSDSCYEKALQLNPNDTYVLNNYAYFLSLRNTNLDKAEAMSKKSNELAKANSSYLDTYAWILYAQKKYSDAKIWMEKALAVDGNKSPVLLEHYGDILYQLDMKELAMEYWIKAKNAGQGYSDFLDKKIQEKRLIE
jgi:tetratricopeptide (TPR) repeat protein